MGRDSLAPHPSSRVSRTWEEVPTLSNQVPPYSTFLIDKGRAPARSAAARPMIESGAAPPMVDALRRVRRWMSRRVFCRFCHARSRVPMVFGPFHYCAFCERAAPDAPETIDDQRRCTGCRDRTIYGGSRGSASLSRRRSGSVLSLLRWIPTVQL